MSERHTPTRPSDMANDTAPHVVRDVDGTVESKFTPYVMAERWTGFAPSFTHEFSTLHAALEFFATEHGRIVLERRDERSFRIRGEGGDVLAVVEFSTVPRLEGT